IITAHCLVIPSGPAQTSKPTRVAWLKDHAFKVRTLDPNDEDFSDLQPLKRILSDSIIVMLGEESHGDGTTFHAKRRIIKFLHKEMGFDVLAFESGIYDCHKAWEYLKNGEPAQKAMERGIYPIWSQSQQVQSLIEYIGAVAKTDHPLEVAGFDCQFSFT